MRSLETVRRALDRPPEEGGEAGMWVGFASGALVALPVLRVFLAFDDDPTVVVLAVALASIAFACTTLGTVLAVRAETPAKAVGWLFLLNVLPPTLACAPSIYGVVFSFPAGLIAFTVVLPLAIWARVGRARPGHESRERLLGAGWLAAMACAMLAFELTQLNRPYATPASYLLLPATVCGLGALGLALASVVPDLMRLWTWRAVVDGRYPGLRARPDGRFSAVIERHTDAGAGPMRSASTSETLGSLSASPARSLLGVATALGATAVCGLSAWAWVMSQAVG